MKFTLFTNHLDAWGITFAIASTAVILHNAVTPHTVALVIAITLCYWLGFAANDYYDAPYDRHDPLKARRNFFVMTPVSTRTAYTFTAAILFFSAAVFASFGVRGILALVPAVFVLWAYSAPPFRLKSRPGFDVLTHAFFVQTFPYFLCLYLLDVTWTPLDRILLVMFFCASFCAQLEQQSRDFEVDSHTDTNFTTLVGLRLNNLLLKLFTAILCLLALVAVIWGMVPLFLLPFAVMMLPFFIHRLSRPAAMPRSERFVFVGVGAMLAYVALIWVWMIMFG